MNECVNVCVVLRCGEKKHSESGAAESFIFPNNIIISMNTWEPLGETGVWTAARLESVLWGTGVLSKDTEKCSFV